MSLQSQLIASVRNPDKFRGMVPEARKPKEVLDKKLTKADVMAAPFRYGKVAAFMEAEVGRAIVEFEIKNGGRLKPTQDKRDQGKVSFMAEKRRKKMARKLTKWYNAIEVLGMFDASDSSVRNDLKTLAGRGDIVERKTATGNVYIRADLAETPIDESLNQTGPQARQDKTYEMLTEWMYTEDVAKALGVSTHTSQKDLHYLFKTGKVTRRKVGYLLKHKRVSS